MFFLHLGIVRMPGADEVIVYEIIEGFLCHESCAASAAFIYLDYSLVTVFPHCLFGDMQPKGHIIKGYDTLTVVK